jgi:type I restriction-modification system DNA methylase subunit
MKSKKEIREQKESDLQFIISAVTAELHDTARLEYFGAWENNGGMGWFFAECVEITKEIMLTEGSQYLKWLDHWINTEDEKQVQGFSELTGETCFDWYHMNEARRIFESRYEKDECSKEEVSEYIGRLVNIYKTDESRSEVVALALAFADKQRVIQEAHDRLKKVIDELKDMNADADTIRTISRALNIS